MLVANIFGGDGLIVVIIALVVIFGGSQLPKIARNVGSAGKEFRKAQQEAEDEASKERAAKAVAPKPIAAPQPPVTATVEREDNVTISKAELEALLDERLGKGNPKGN